MPARLPRPDRHPIRVLRQMEEQHRGHVVCVGLVTYVSGLVGHPLKTTSDFGEDRGVDEVDSRDVTPATLHERFELLGEKETLGLSSSVWVDDAEMFLPQVDFLTHLRPEVPPALREYFSLASPALYRTEASWHLYGNRLRPAVAWAAFLLALEEARCHAFKVDEEWLRCSRERGYSVLRWSRKAGRPGGNLPTAADSLERSDG